MKKIFFLLLFTVIHQSNIAQKSYNILYNGSTWHIQVGKFLPALPLRLVIDDSVCYQYYITGKQKVKPPYGKYFLGHSTFINLPQNLIISQSYPYQSKKYRIIDTIPKIEWEFFDEQKTILNYVCKKATCIYNDGMYIAWYTEKIPASFGPMY